MVQIPTLCRAWKLRYQRGCQTCVVYIPRVDYVKLAFIEIFDETSTLSQNANCKSNLPEMLTVYSLAFPNIQEYYLFLALYMSKTNCTTKSFKNKITMQNVLNIYV